MTTADDPFQLQRFLNAQESTFAVAHAELAAGQKQSHWMWFIFPQIKGLGSSPMAQRFAITGIQEAAAYLQHPALGHRLENCATLVNGLDRSIQEIFGHPDDLKFHSSMTLFAEANEYGQCNKPAFRLALARHFANRPDEGTLRQLRSLR